ncbi:unnamed protein product [Brachionus calyciflorus]|uniref:alpha-1,2-Mannosidase n=1 Tax=Brachionus calyciflorus TaxID=104777 RepID=A0A813XPZ5_9BILA|nr:unnamed protein product [Brachionus calyciflorus]
MSQPLLPIFNVRNTNKRFKSTFYNEKNLILILLGISVFTVIFIVYNLPSDIGRVVNNNNFKNVFIPEFKESNVQRHFENHQHPAPPINDDKGLDKQIESNKIANNEDKKILDDTNKDHIIDEPDLNSDIKMKRDKIKEMTLFGWKNYEKYAWGENELKPLSKVGHSAGIFGNKPTKLGATIVDGLDTMYLMGYMDEYKRGREWILNNLNLNVDSEFSVFEINIRFIGGLLSLYTLTNDKVFLDKAEEIAKLILPAFDTPTGIPMALINPITKHSKNYNWAPGSCSILAEFGTLSLEFQYLTDLTGNKIFSEKIDKINKVLASVDKENGVYYNYLNPSDPKWCMKDASIGALGDSYYEYLYKAWLYGDKKDDELLKTYLAAMKAVREKLLDYSPKEKMAFFGDLKSGYRLEKKMDHLACFSGGLLALTSKETDNMDAETKKVYLDLGANITNTCHESYIRTPTHIGPEAFHFERPDQEAYSLKQNEKYYILRPETFESYFYLWRLTKDNKYREWAWDAVQAIEKYCRTDAGYSGLKDVYEQNPVQDDVQQSFFFAETLKYLYLIFSDDDVLPLDKYVFNTEAHPFLIRSHQNKSKQ